MINHSGGTSIKMKSRNKVGQSLAHTEAELASGVEATVDQCGLATLL